MIRETAIVTAGWAEVSANPAETGFFEEDQLNSWTVPEILINLVRRYTTVIANEVEGTLTPIGSGRFVRRADSQHGILTAGQVMGAIRSRENIATIQADRRGRGCKVLVPRSSQRLHHRRGARSDAAARPDQAAGQPRPTQRCHGRLRRRLDHRPTTRPRAENRRIVSRR